MYLGSLAKISDPLRRAKLQGFLSTPCFITSLTDVSHKLSMMQTSPAEKRLELIRDLTQINEHLPARVYLPFVNDSARNYAVLHITALESRIFQTKSRAPVLLCIEVYRPDELSEHIEAQEPVNNNITTSKNFLSKIFTEKMKKKKSATSPSNMKAKLANILGGNAGGGAIAKKKSAGSRGSSDQGWNSGPKSRDRSDSDVIDKMADLKVSNPLFVGASKISNHSFIRYVKAESQCHPKNNQSAGKFLTHLRPNEKNISDGAMSS